MLSQLGRHGGFDLTVAAVGDLDVDAHHTVEDVGIALGEVVAEALGDKAGVRRFASIALPLDEALVDVALDLSGRPFLAYGDRRSPPTPPALGTPPFDPQLAEEFWRAFVTAAAVTLHVRLVAGRNTHHILEASFKARRPVSAGRRAASRAGGCRRPRARCDRRPPSGDRRPRLRDRQPAVGREGPPAGGRRRPPGGRPGRGRRGRRDRAARCGGLRSLRGRAGGERPRRRGPRRRGPRPAVPRDLRRVPVALRGFGGGSRGRGPRGPARHRAPPRRRGQAPPDAVERRSTCGSRRGSWPASPTPPGSTSSTPTPPSAPRDTTATCDYGGPVVAAAERGPVWGTQFHPEKSGSVGLGILANFVGPRRPGRRPATAPATSDRDGPVPGHRHPRRWRGAAHPGRLRPPERLRRPGGAGRTVRGRTGPRGSTWSTSTRPAPAEPVNRATVLAIAARRRRAGRGRRRGAHRGGRRRAARTAGWPGSSSAPPRCSTIPPWCAGPRPPIPGGWRSGSTTGGPPTAGPRSPCGAGSRARVRPSARCWTRWRAPGLAAVVVTAIERDGMLAGPDLDGLRTRAGARPSAGHRLGWRGLGDRHRGPGRPGGTGPSGRGDPAPARGHHRARPWSTAG